MLLNIGKHSTWIGKTVEAFNAYDQVKLLAIEFFDQMKFFYVALYINFR